MLKNDVYSTTYKKCCSCSYIVKENDSCPFCINDKYDRWPSKAASGFLFQMEADIYGEEDGINEYLGFHVYQTASLYYCFAYEVLLEGLLIDLLESVDTPKKIALILLDAFSGQEKMSKLFHKVTSYPLRDVFDEVYQGFFDKSKNVFKLRNAYVHGDYDVFDDIENASLKDLDLQILEVFSLVHNKYISKAI